MKHAQPFVLTIIQSWYIMVWLTRRDINILKYKQSLLLLNGNSCIRHQLSGQKVNFFCMKSNSIIVTWVKLYCRCTISPLYMINDVYLFFIILTYEVRIYMSVVYFLFSVIKYSQIIKFKRWISTSLISLDSKSVH